MTQDPRPLPTALILGAAVWRDGPSPTLRRRAAEGARLWHAGRVGHLVACGGLGRFPPTEAAMIAQLLRDDGVPDRAISLEDLSVNTRENIGLALPLLMTRDVVIVTDRWHGPRARLIARRLGLRPLSSAPPLRGTRPLAQAKMALREVPGYLWHWISFRP